MNYASNSPSDLLASRAWRRRHSAWLLAPILGVGVFSFIGFLYCALRIRNAKWWRIAGVTAVLSAIAWVLMSLFSEPQQGSKPSGPGSGLASGYMFALWIGLIIYGVIVNRDYLRWRAGQSESNAWYNQPAGTNPAVGLAPPPTQTVQVQAPSIPRETAYPLDIDGGDYYAPRQKNSAAYATPATYAAAPAHASGPVDINSADAFAIASGVGLDLATAERVVRAREQRRGFHGLDDLVAAAGLQPHELLKMRGKVSFGPFQPSMRPPTSAAAERPAPPTEPRSGRILDY